MATSGHTKGVAMKVLITCMDKDFDKKLAEIFSNKGYEVIKPGDKPDTLDFLIDTSDFCHPDDNGANTEIMEQVFHQNVIIPMKNLEDYLPMLDKGEGKRLFYLTSASASINETNDTKNYAYNMSKAALHQFIQMTRNKLAPKGYTFRVFDPMTHEYAAEAAFNYITRRRGTENYDPNRDDEATVVFRDAEGRQHSW